MEKRNHTVPKEPVESSFGIFLWEREKFDRRVSILEAFTSNPLFSKGIIVYPSMARKDVWTRAAEQSRELIRLKLENQWSRTQFMEAIRMSDNFLPVQPQFRIFMSNLERQMSDEQKAFWVPKAERFEILGSYAQTELGHGSNVRGIETTATFDETTDEFIIDSPTTSSTKYWIGATGMLTYRYHLKRITLIDMQRCMGNSLHCCSQTHYQGQRIWQPSFLDADSG
jgi:acyl-CoA oxidase